MFGCDPLHVLVNNLTAAGRERRREREAFAGCQWLYRRTRQRGQVGQHLEQRTTETAPTARWSRGRSALPACTRTRTHVNAAFASAADDRDDDDDDDDDGGGDDGGDDDEDGACYSAPGQHLSLVLHSANHAFSSGTSWYLPCPCCFHVSIISCDVAFS